jgi:molybdopterin synthase catalytic subunit
MMEGDRIDIIAQPLEVGPIVAFVSVPAAGGIDVFLGTTRAEKHAGGRELIALDYEAYEPMAMKQLQDLAAEARRRWPIVRLAIVHRTGRVALAEPSVVIAVSTPHRADAFAACRWIIDTLKKDVAIWKKEVWSDGSGTWVDPSSSPLASGEG